MRLGQTGALETVMSIGEKIAEVPRRVFGESRRDSRAITLEPLRQVRVPDPEARAASFPHQLTGGGSVSVRRSRWPTGSW